MSDEIRQALRRVLELAWQYQVDLDQIQQMLMDTERDYRKEIKS